MPDETFPNNSQRKPAEPEISEEASQEIEKIISGEAIARKPSGFRRFRKSFIAGDATSVSEHVFWNLLVPAAKDTVSDLASTFIDMMIFGEKRQRFGNPAAPSSGIGSNSKFNYTAISSASPVGFNPQAHEEIVRSYNPQEITVATRSEAEAILTKMFQVLEKYKVVTVANFFTMCGITDSNYMNTSYGWTDLGDADIRRVGGGRLLIVLPPPKDLNH